jgi:Sec-independent protein translocase protein TatA
MKLILLLIGIYILYRFIFGFVLPVANATRQMKKKMQEFHQQQESMFAQQHSGHTQATHTNTKAAADDYIEFEEVK